MPPAPPDLVILLRLVVALALGAAIGWEREEARKAAGLRTHMLVALAAALFVAVGDAFVDRFAAQDAQSVLRADPVRIIEAIVTGVSFLGAGVIFVRRGRERVIGLTTAASLWATASLCSCGTIAACRRTPAL
jgi:putative Mg2+ transporter-C (MgtC) family protein